MAGIRHPHRIQSLLVHVHKRHAIDALVGDDRQSMNQGSNCKPRERINANSGPSPHCPICQSNHQPRLKGSTTNERSLDATTSLTFHDAAPHSCKSIVRRRCHRATMNDARRSSMRIQTKDDFERLESSKPAPLQSYILIFNESRQKRISHRPFLCFVKHPASQPVSEA